MAKIGLIQVDNKMDGDIEARQNALIDLGTKCLEEGADLVFFPEAFQYVKHREIVQNKDQLRKVETAWQERCAALARKYHAYVVPWDYHVDENGAVYNSSYILDREGRFVGRYCKCNLTSNEMKRGLAHGMEYPVFDLDIGRVGIIICFDNYFPEAAASLGNKGAQLVLYPLYGDTLKPQWEMKLRTRAIDHSLYMASCQLDPKWDIAYTGIVDPVGNVIARLDAQVRLAWLRTTLLVLLLNTGDRLSDLVLIEHLALFVPFYLSFLSLISTGVGHTRNILYLLLYPRTQKSARCV